MQLSKQIYKRLLTLLLGLGLTIFGGTQIMIDLTSPNHISDQEIISRAKAMGLQEMKDVYKEKTENKTNTGNDGKTDTTNTTEETQKTN